MSTNTNTSGSTGTAHKVLSSCLRVLEFCCSGIILGLLSRFFYLLDQLDGPNDSRLIFALSMAAISVFFTIILVPPVKYSFYCFPIDFSIFVCWITCYALLQDVCVFYGINLWVLLLGAESNRYSSPARARAPRRGSHPTGPSTGTAPPSAPSSHRRDAPSGESYLDLPLSWHSSSWAAALWLVTTPSLHLLFLDIPLLTQHSYRAYTPSYPITTWPSTPFQELGMLFFF
jgi:hypothetical protein